MSRPLVEGHWSLRKHQLFAADKQTHGDKGYDNDDDGGGWDYYDDDGDCIDCDKTDDDGD